MPIRGIQITKKYFIKTNKNYYNIKTQNKNDILIKSSNINPIKFLFKKETNCINAESIMTYDKTPVSLEVSYNYKVTNRGVFKSKVDKLNDFTMDHLILLSVIEIFSSNEYNFIINNMNDINKLIYTNVSQEFNKLGFECVNCEITKFTTLTKNKGRNFLMSSAMCKKFLFINF
jgi:regulator of protease activity HflC (stomatin/prohibitin superfamily)